MVWGCGFTRGAPLFSENQIKIKMTEASIKIIGFCCKNAIESDPVLAEKEWHAFEPEIKIISVPCSSKVETLGIIKTFESGADGIFVLGCPDEKCHLLDGNYRARKVVNYTKELLDEIGIGSARLEMFQLETPEGQHIEEIINSMTKRIESLGSNPVN